MTKKHLTSLVFALLSLITANVSAQSFNVKGIVTDNQTGTPIVGCSISVEGTQKKNVD